MNNIINKMCIQPYIKYINKINNCINYKYTNRKNNKTGIIVKSKSELGFEFSSKLSNLSFNNLSFSTSISNLACLFISLFAKV